MFYMCYSFLAFKIPPLSKGNPTVYQQDGCQTERSTKFSMKKSNIKFRKKKHKENVFKTAHPPHP